MGIFCRTTLNYVKAGVGPVPIEVDILDGRDAGLPAWQECGFEIVPHPSAVSDWTDREEIAAVHHAETEQLAKAMTGADVAMVSSHILRGPAAAKQHEQLSPITFAHSDFDKGQELIRNNYLKGGVGTGAALARNGATIDDVRDASRVVTLQFWRNVGPAKMDYPLGWCDARSVTVDDGAGIHVENYAGTGATFDALAMLVPDGPLTHDWYGFPEMKPDETVAFRTYDTDLVREGKVWFTPHSAFHDPSVTPGQPARESIELRATCLFA
jgi:hypothetical protein